MLLKAAIQTALRRFVLPVTTLILPLFACCQSYSYNEVIQKSDSVLQTILPKFLWPAAKLYNTPYYLSIGTEENWLTLEKGTSTQRRLQQLTVIYELVLKQTSCAQYKDLRALITMHFDSSMHLIDHTGTDVIPDFILNNMPCPFISYPELKEVLRKNNIPDDVRMRQVSYNKESKRFEYLIVAQIMQPSDTSSNGKRIQLKTIRLNAETGEVIENNFGNEPRK